MNRDKILEKVKSIIESDYADTGAIIEEDDRLREDIGIDSLSKLDLFIEIEKTYGVEIPDSDLEEILTVRELTDYLLTRI